MGLIGDFIEDCVEMAKYAVEEACDTVCYTISDIFGGSGGGSVSSSSGSSEHALKIAAELADMKEKMEVSTRKYEANIMNYVNKSMDQFMKDVESINGQTFGGESLCIHLEAIQEMNKKLKGQITGCLSTVMSTRLVQTDKELSVILEEKNDKKRNKEFNDFVKRIQGEAIGHLTKEIEKTINAQFEVIATEIRARQQEVGARLEESVKEFQEIMEAKARDDSGLEKKQIGFMYESTLCDFALREVEG